jgi:hypothetical protein
MNTAKKARKPSHLIWMMAGFLGVLSIAIYMAVITGQKSPLYASGIVEISPELVPAAKGMRTLFLVALPPAESGMRMPIGAARFSVSQDASGRFVHFALTPETMQVMPGSASGGMPAQFRLKARLDADGTAGMDQPGDLVGELESVTTGSRNLVITINRVASGVVSP